MLNPPASILVLVYTAAFFMVAAGFTQILFAIKIRHEIKGEWALYLSGIISVLLGALIFFRIGIGSLTVVYIIAAWAVVIGVLRISFALRARKLVKSMSTTT